MEGEKLDTENAGRRTIKEFNVKETAQLELINDKL